MAQPYMPPPAQPPRRLPWAQLAIVAVLTIAACAAVWFIGKAVVPPKHVPAPITDGIYWVGVDVQPGDYHFTDSSGGRWDICEDSQCQVVAVVNLADRDEGTLTIPTDAEFIRIQGMTLTRED
ncbi:hypothetical protein AB4Z55_26250 [Gordonia sp. ABKF26]|jgi:hypothetical protein|uniref:hypothetical protein n=1 Tax=Gordonia sp. ABKF26 TaxID=3238687 RepID=UPI0034E3FDC8